MLQRRGVEPLDKVASADHHVSVMIRFTIHEDRHLIGGPAVGPIGRPPANLRALVLLKHSIDGTIHGPAYDADGGAARGNNELLPSESVRVGGKGVSYRPRAFA